MSDNRHSLDTLCGALAYAMDIQPPKHAAQANPILTKYVDEAFLGQKCDRIFMYNPDAIGQWIYEKYPDYFQTVTARTELEVPLHSPMPPKTPVCFATMYTGAQPEVHGIQKYEKFVLTVDTLFDALVRSGKKPAIVAYGTSSMSIIFGERPFDCFILDNIEQVNAKAAQLIMDDTYDFIAVYNGNYDRKVHDYGCEDPRTLAELRVNTHIFSVFYDLIHDHWKPHNTLIGFAMDHGCHFVRPGKGSHGLDIPEDRQIIHLYKALPKGEEK